MNELFLAELKNSILARIDVLQKATDASKDARATVNLDQQSVGRLSRMDAMQQQAMANASEAMRATELASLRLALKRLDDGEFGYCADCGDAIETERLSRAPTARKCLDCARG